MVFEVSGNQQLSQKNAKTMKQRCIELITRAACIDQIRNDVIKPALEFYAQQPTPRTIGHDSVFLAWMLMRQGTMLCLLLNNFRSGILETFNPLKKPISSEAIFTDQEAKENIRLFLTACQGDLYMTDDQLFSADSLYTDDTNTLSKAMSLTDNFFVRIGRIQSLNYDKKFESIQAEDKLFSLEDSTKEEISSNGGKDLRLCVLREMLDTEQGYVADLDKLQSYSEELRIDKIISSESWDGIFANLDALADFQRRFMLQMEAKLTKTALTDLQASYKTDIGQLFLDNEKGFSVYEVFCANQSKAERVITEEVSSLAKKANIMEPNVVLRAYLIKPLQRICKYPLLIRELIKRSPVNAPDLGELEKAWRVCDEVTKRVNERKRNEENTLAAEELCSLVKDWRGIDQARLGNLLFFQSGQLAVGGDGFKDMEFYLFSNAFLAFGKSKSMANYFVGNRKLARQQLMLKFNIAPSRISSVVNNGNTLILSFQRGQAVEYLNIKFRMEEQINQWLTSINALVEKQKVKEITKPLTIRERRRSILGVPVGPPVNAAPPVVSSGVGVAATSVVATAAVAPSTTIEVLRLKIYWKDDIFVSACPDEIATMSELKTIILKKLTSSLRLLGQPYDDLAPEDLTLKYYDDQKDLISLLDDADVAAALMFNPTSLNVRVILAADSLPNTKSMASDNFLSEITTTDMNLEKDS